MKTATSSMPENVPKPTIMLTIAPVAKLRSANTVRSRIGSRVVSSRIRKATSAQTATTLSAPIVRDANQSSRSPRSRTSCRQPKPATISPRPHQSIREARRRYGGSKRKTLARKKPTIPTGRLM